LVGRIREGSLAPRNPTPSAGPASVAGRADAAVPDPLAATASDTPQRTSGHGSFLARLESALGGRYAFEGPPEIGRDGSARLIRARDLRHDRPVTLKVVQPALASVLDVERF